MMVKEIAYARCRFAQQMIESLQSRADLFVGLFQGAAAATLNVAVLATFYANTPMLGSWTFSQALVLGGVFLICEAWLNAVVLPNLSNILERVRTGEIDTLLTRPLDLQVVFMFDKFSPWRSLGAPFGAGLILYGAANSDTAPAHVLLALPLLLLSLCIISLLGFLTALSTFWFRQERSIVALAITLFDTGRLPTDSYPLYLRIVLTSLLPLYFVTNIPAHQVIGSASWDSIAGALAVALVLFLLGRRLLGRALSRYSSVGG